jgi:dTDP-4-amino-4,6-dideoxygalactose transaminase
MGTNGESRNRMTLVPAQEIRLDAADRRSILEQIGQVLDSGRLSAGVHVEQFEDEMARYVGTQHAIAVSSGTMALELILLSLQVRGKGVIVPANTNFATFVAASRAGADVLLCDVDPQTLSPRPADLAAVATPETKAVLLVHMGGVISPDVAALGRWCADNDIALIEDAAHAHGSARNGTSAGSFGLAGAFSFFATKVMTTGEGGMVVTDDASLAAEVRLYRNLGKAEAWVSHHTRMGPNGRMSEIPAIVGRHQLARLDEYVDARRRIADGYAEALAGTNGLEMLRPGHPYSGYKAIAMLSAEADRERIKGLVAADGVQLAGEVYAEPLHHQPVLASEYGHLVFPGAEFACARQICLPIYPSLDAGQAELVTRSVTKHVAAEAGTP